MVVLSRRARDSYMELVDAFPLVGIRSDKHLAAAQEVVDRLLRQKLDGGGSVYLDVLSDLMGDYEDEHHPIATSSPIQMLRHLMDAHSLSQAAVCSDIAVGRSTLSQFLSGKRELSKSTAKKLAAYFEVDLALFL